MVMISKGALFWDPLGTVKKAIKGWSPENCESEKDYENSLYNFLHEHSEDVQITKQYGVGRTRADLNVGDKVLIEIKKDLQSKTHYDRLIGQLEDYLKWKRVVIILLVGETDPNLKKKLHSRANQGLYSADFYLIEKV